MLKRLEHTFLSGYLVFHHLHRHAGWRTPLSFEEPWNVKRILAWLEKHQPDAVVAAYPSLRQAIEAKQVPAKRRPRIALVNVLESSKPGIDQRHDLIAAGAVDLVDARHKRNETSHPERPKTLMIRGGMGRGMILTNHKIWIFCHHGKNASANPRPPFQRSQATCAGE